MFRPRTYWLVKTERKPQRHYGERETHRSFHGAGYSHSTTHANLSVPQTSHSIVQERELIYPV